MKNHFGQSSYQSVNGESPRAAWAEQGALSRARVSLEPLDPVWITCMSLALPSARHTEAVNQYCLN